MKTKNRLTLLISFLLISGSVFSQGISSSTTDSTLYLFPQFTDGSVTLKDGSVWFGKLNYDTFRDQMQFLGPNNVIMELGEPEKVSNVAIAKRHFINYKNNFIEFITNGPVFLGLKIHTSRIAKKVGAYGTSSTSSNITPMSYTRINAIDITDLSVTENIKYHTDLNFYLINGKDIREIKNQKDLLKCFSLNKNQLKQEIKSENTKFNSIASMNRIMDWINGKGIKN